MKRIFSLSRTLTMLALVCAVVIAVSMDAIETRYGLRADYSFNSVSTQSAQTEEVLSALDKDVRVYEVYTQGNEDAALTEILNRYAAKSPRITLSLDRAETSPLLMTQVSSEITDSAASGDCLIIRCEETGRTRILTAEDYIERAYDAQTGQITLSGLTYEKAISEAILYVTRDELPVISFLTGHGELTETERAALTDALERAGFSCEEINLLSGDVPDPQNLMMILSPTSDWTEEELNQMLAFSDGGGQLFVTSDFTDPGGLTNYESFLRAYGITLLPGVVISSGGAGEYYGDNPAYLLPEMVAHESVNALIAASHNTILLAGARALKAGDSALPILRTKGSAYIRDFERGDTSLDKREGDTEGIISLALLGTRALSDGTYSRVFAIGSSTPFVSDWVLSSTHAEDLLTSMISYLRGKEQETLPIAAKTAMRPGLTLTSVTPALLIAAALPVIVLVCALCVLSARRRR